MSVIYIRNNQSDKRRWATAVNRVWMGVWSSDVDKLWKVTLTTKDGTDNSWSKMSADFKLLVRRFRNDGLCVEYVMAPELSPGKKLLHLHGIFRITKGELTTIMLQELWNDIHGAIQVDLRREKDFKKWNKYIVKHMLKEYPEAIGFKGRMLVSRGWLPSGWKEARKVLVRWALERVGYYSDPWPIMNDMMERWCRGQTIMIAYGGKWLFLGRGINGDGR